MTCALPFEPPEVHLHHQLCKSADSYLSPRKMTMWMEFNHSTLQLGKTSWTTISDHGQPVGNMRLIVTRLLWWWRLTTPQLNCSELPWCLADRVSSGSRALRPQHRDPSLTKYSQASTWRSRSKANIIVDLVMLLLKITKALIKLGKTDRPVERRRKYAFLEPNAEEQTNSSLQRRKTWQHVVNSEVWIRYVQWLSEHRTMKPEEKHSNRQCFVCL